MPYSAMLSFLLATAAPEVEAKTLRLEVEVERGKELSSLTVYISNGTTDPFAFETGAVGGPGSLDDRHMEVTGTAPTTLPELTFGAAGGQVVLRPPALGGPTLRSMRRETLTVKPGERIRYASWAVPTAHIAGKLESVALAPRERKEPLLLSYPEGTH